MSTFSEIESAISRLNVAELAELARVVRHELEQRRQAPNGGASTPRVLGLHPGAWSAEPDFDAPLPDDFWLGNDA